VSTITVIGRPSHDRDIEVVAAQRCNGLGAIADGQRNFDLGMQFGESRDRERHKIFGGTDRAYRNPAAGPSRHHVQRRGTGRHGGLDPFRQRQYLAAGVGQDHTVAGALGQRQAGEALQVAQLQGNRRLRQMQFAGCRRDAAACGQRRQRAQLANGDIAKAARHIRKTFDRAMFTQVPLFRPERQYLWARWPGSAVPGYRKAM
jgi:hypothetical protein